MPNVLASRLGLVIGVLGLLLVSSLSPSAAIGQSNDTESSNSTASVEIEAECKWFVYNVPASVSLSPEGAAKYTGNELALKATATDITIRKSGSDEGADSFSDCSFFGDKTFPTLYAHVGGTSFDATYGAEDTEDTGMDFTIEDDGESGFKLDASECTNNTGIWNHDTNAETDGHYFLTGSYLDSPFLKMTSLSDVNNSLTGEEDTQECVTDLDYEVMIPADLEPNQPSETYNYEGPSVEITVVYFNS